MKSNLYSKIFLLNTRIISIFAIIFLLITNIWIFFPNNQFVGFEQILITKHVTLILNTVCIICFALLAIFPKKIFILAIISFLYSMVSIIVSPNNLMAPLMMFLGFYALYLRNFFAKHKVIKIIILVSVYTAAFLSELRFGIFEFVKTIFDFVVFCFIFVVILYLCKQKMKIELEQIFENKVLNLKKIPGTNESDVELLQMVLDNKQYKVIALTVFKAEGTVRNRLNKLYDILEVGDRNGFISKYTGYNVIFE